jgi:hypothetical protein
LCAVCAGFSDASTEDADNKLKMIKMLSTRRMVDVDGRERK